MSSLQCVCVQSAVQAPVQDSSRTQVCIRHIMRLKSPAPLKYKAQLHKIGGSEQRRRDEDDEGILPDRSIKATCQQHSRKPSAAAHIGMQMRRHEAYKGIHPDRPIEATCLTTKGYQNYVTSIDHSHASYSVSFMALLQV